jgi:nifR3 family TIM-barrel protein
LHIGPLRLRTNLLLAPIAGYCDLAFRTICRELGGVGLACTDLLSPQGLLRGTASSLDLAKTNAQDKPVGMQLYGSDPEIMAQGARWAVEHGATLVDINMGCPVDKVTKKDGGSKLLTDLSRAVAIAARVRQELDRLPLSASEWSARLGDASMRGPATVPLTCKMRLCWHDADFLAGRACSPHLAVALADVGVAAVTIHGRTTEMKFSGEVRLPGIARVVEAVQIAARTSPPIPVIGNGDVREAGDVPAMIRATGCAGVMIGRGGLSTPWLFRDAWTLQTSGIIPPEPADPEKIAIIRRFFDLMREHRDDRYAMFQLRRRISWFGKRLACGCCKPLKEAIRTSVAPEDIYAALDAFAAGGLRSSSPEPQEALG